MAGENRNRGRRGSAVKAYQEAPRAAGRIYRFIKEDIEEFLEEARKYAEGEG